MVTKIKKVGVLGYPVAHSRSPAIHNYWLDKYGISGSYDLLEVESEKLSIKIKKLLEEGFLGVNVTVPHKEKVVELVDELSETAKNIGAINTITFDKDKKIIKGDNTDSYGFIQNIKNKFVNFDFKQAPTFILGAGGATRAIVYGLIKEGVPEIIICNRTYEKSVKLREDFPGNIRTVYWEDREKFLEHTLLLVNTTSLGMEGQNTLEISLSNLSVDALVTDIVYKPLKTNLLIEAQNRGNPILDGAGMLLFQAARAFYIWFGIMPEVSQELRELVL